MAKGVVSVKIVGDARGLTKELGRSSDSLKKWGDRLSVSVTPALALLGKTSVEAASSLEEAGNKVNVVFGSAAGTVQTFAANASRAIGQSSREALEAAGNFGNMFNTVGLAGNAAADMSVTMVRLASDMASFNDEDPSAMLDRLRSGLAGEAEPLRRFGVLLSAAEVNAKAYSSGIAAVGSELTEAQKVQARYQLILEQTAVQQGDFTRTSEGLANSQRILAAQWEDSRAQLGEQLLPVMTDLVGVASSALDAFSALPDGVQRTMIAFGGLAAIVGPAISATVRLRATLHSLALINLTPLGIGLTAAAGAVALVARAHLEGQARVREWTAAIEADSGMLGENTRAKIENSVASADLFGSLSTVGVSVETLTEHLLGNEEATARLNAALAEAQGELDGMNEAADAGGMRGYTEANHELGSALGELRGFIGDTTEDLDEFQAGWRESAEAQALASERHVRFQELLEEGLPRMTAWALANAEASGTADDAAGSLDGLSGEMTEASGAASTLIERLDILNGRQISLDEATIRYERAVAALRGELEDGTREFDLNSEAGRENTEAVLDLLGESRNLIETMDDEGASLAQLNHAMLGHVDDLVDVMEQAGFTEEQIADLIEQYNLTPDEIRTTIRADNVDETMRELSALDDKIGDVGQTLRSVSADFNLSVSSGPGGDGYGMGGGRPPRLSISGGTGDGPGFGGEPSESVRSRVDVEALLDNVVTEDMPALGMLSNGIGWQAMMEALRQVFPGLPLISGLRPGAITATGNPSYHGFGRAVDIPPSMEVFNAIANSPVAAITKELIFSPAGNRQIHNGRPHVYSGITRDMHWDHIHWALANGGIVKATPGGTRAILGEGGSDEVVAPLDGGAVNVRVVNSPPAPSNPEPGRPYPFVPPPADPSGRPYSIGVDTSLSGGVHRPHAALDAEIAGNMAAAAAANMPPHEELAAVNEQLAGTIAWTDEWVALMERARELSEEIAKAAAAKTDAVKEERERLNSLLGKELDARERLNDQLLDLERDHADRVARVREDLADRTAEAVKRRIDELVAFTPTQGFGSTVDDRFVLANLFDPDAQFALGAGVASTAGASLLEQLAASNGDLAEMSRLLEEIRGDGLDERVIRLLGLDAPQQLDLLREVSGYTLDEVDSLNALVAERFRLAGAQVSVEQSNLYGTLGEEISALRQVADEQMAGLNEAFAAASAGIAAEVASISSSIDELLSALDRLPAAGWGPTGGPHAMPSDPIKENPDLPGRGRPADTNVIVNVDGKEVASASETYLGTKDFGTRLKARA